MPDKNEFSPIALKERYDRGENITAFLREQEGTSINSEKIVEIAYDLQAGSFENDIADPEIGERYNQYARTVAETINSFPDTSTIMEAGIGEGTTLTRVLKHVRQPHLASYGFDISWSRLALARKNLAREQTNVCVGSLFHIPYADSSIDVVYTSHSIEPNGGNERPILEELYRITRQYLVLLEPAYEFAGSKEKQRMENHGYCKNIAGISRQLGYEILEHKLMPHATNPLNPTAMTIIRKPVTTGKPTHVLACPVYKTPIQEIGRMLYSPEALTVYPVIGGIPCLRIEQGIVASKFPELCGSAPA